MIVFRALPGLPCRSQPRLLCVPSSPVSAPQASGSQCCLQPAGFQPARRSLGVSDVGPVEPRPFPLALFLKPPGSRPIALLGELVWLDTRLRPIPGNAWRRRAGQRNSASLSLRTSIRGFALYIRLAQNRPSPAFARRAESTGKFCLGRWLLVER